MNVRWTRTALRDLESTHAYIAADNPSAAEAFIDRLLSGIDALSQHTDMGRKGRVPGTRELIINPFIVAYRSRRTDVEVLAILHAARRWPDGF
jgi:toxin ParE1/3/4